VLDGFSFLRINEHAGGNITGEESRGSKMKDRNLEQEFGRRLVQLQGGAIHLLLSRCDTNPRIHGGCFGV
jgi:hypothetical protein